MENELIRRGDVLDKVVIYPNYSENGLSVDTYVVFDDDVMSIPAVDAVEVRHGHWVTEEEAIEKGDYSLRDTCSVCGHCDWDCTESENFNYCPNCGAKMDREEEN